MSDLLDECVPRVNPLSMAMIEELGRVFLAQLCPDTLESPKALDVCNLIDISLPQYGIHISPASPEELDNREAATLISQNGHEIEILVSENVWDNVRVDTPISYYARSTVCHEIGHATMHIPALKRSMNHSVNSLARIKRKNLKPYEDPEWQAWAFAGAILMPSSTLKTLSMSHDFSSTMASDIYKISEPMARNHMKRLKWLSV